MKRAAKKIFKFKVGKLLAETVKQTHSYPMNPEIIIPALFVTVVFTAWTIGTYNKFIKYRSRIEESLNGIDVALKRRPILI